MLEFYRQLTGLMLPEIILAVAGCGLLLLGISAKQAARRAAPVVALLTLIVVFAVQIMQEPVVRPLADQWNTVQIFEFTQFIKMIAAGVGVLLVLLAWPTNPNATGNPAMNFGQDADEFFALLLLSICGLLITAGANDIILLFLGIELAAIPTYIMVSISRNTPLAQEAGVKYFFLGAMAAAIILFGFSYLYGTTGTLKLHEIAQVFRGEAGPMEAPVLNSWQLLAIVMLVLGLCFKIAAVPLHYYVGDVYQGAATPVTAFLSFVPKVVGFVALIKIMLVAGGGTWRVPETIVILMWVLAALTMTAGNVLGLLQFNVKRVLAYSSVAHSGYMLVGLTALISAGGFMQLERESLQGILFYLTAYGLMNAAAFGVLMLLPARTSTLRATPAGNTSSGNRTDDEVTSAETFDDIAGQGRRNPALGLAMAVACFSLTGLPLTIGFFGKLYLILPALHAGLIGLAIIMLINAAIAAAYYLRIVATMFLRPEPEGAAAEPESEAPSAAPAGNLMPISLAVWLSVGGTLLFGTLLPATQVLTNQVMQASDLGHHRVIPPFEAETAASPLDP